MRALASVLIVPFKQSANSMLYDLIIKQRSFYFGYFLKIFNTFLINYCKSNLKRE